MLLKVPDTGPRRAFVHLPSCKHSVLVAQRFLIISFWNLILIKLITKKLTVHLTITVICVKCVCCNSCRAQDIYHQAAKQTFFFSSWSCNIFTKTTHFIAWREKDCGYFCYEMQCKQCYERNGIFLDILDLMEETFFWCNISQAVTLGLLLFCLEFRPCTALQTFFLGFPSFFARFKHILRRSQLPPRLLPILCTAAALSFLIEYFVLETNFQLPTSSLQAKAMIYWPLIHKGDETTALEAITPIGAFSGSNGFLQWIRGRLKLHPMPGKLFSSFIEIQMTLIFSLEAYRKHPCKVGIINFWVVLSRVQPPRKSVL